MPCVNLHSNSHVGFGFIPLFRLNKFLFLNSWFFEELTWITAHHTIATIPELIYDTRDSDGLDFDDKAGIDDPYDSASYCCMALAKPNPERPRIVVPEHYAMYDNVSTTEPYDWRNP